MKPQLKLIDGGYDEIPKSKGHLNKRTRKVQPADLAPIYDNIFRLKADIRVAQDNSEYHKLEHYRMHIQQLRNLISGAGISLDKYCENTEGMKK